MCSCSSFRRRAYQSACVYCLPAAILLPPVAKRACLRACLWELAWSLNAALQPQSRSLLPLPLRGRNLAIRSELPPPTPFPALHCPPSPYPCMGDFGLTLHRTRVGPPIRLRAPRATRRSRFFAALPLRSPLRPGLHRQAHVSSFRATTMTSCVGVIEQTCRFSPVRSYLPPAGTG